MIEIRNLSKTFGPLVAVNDVSFVVKRGEVLGFLGPNGAGKSTTMKMLAGFLPPSGGSAHICGIDVGHHNLPAALNHKACGYSTNAVSTAYYYREVIACVVHRLAFIIGNNKLV